MHTSTLKLNSKYYAVSEAGEYYELYVVKEGEDTLFLMASDQIGRLPAKTIDSIAGNMLFLSSSEYARLLIC